MEVASIGAAEVNEVVQGDVHTFQHVVALQDLQDHVGRLMSIECIFGSGCHIIERIQDTERIGITVLLIDFHFARFLIPEVIGQGARAEKIPLHARDRECGCCRIGIVGSVLGISDGQLCTVGLTDLSLWEADGERTILAALIEVSLGDGEDAVHAIGDDDGHIDSGPVGCDDCGVTLQDCIVFFFALLIGECGVSGQRVEQFLLALPQIIHGEATT